MKSIYTEVRVLFMYIYFRNCFVFFFPALDVKFSLPERKQELISVSHEIVFNNRRLEEEIEVPLQFGAVKQRNVCVDGFRPIIGLSFCAGLVRPNQDEAHVRLPYPFNGNSKFDLTIDNDDFGYIHGGIQESYIAVKREQTIKMFLNVIGTNQQKKTSLGAVFIPFRDFSLKMYFQSQFKNALAEVALYKNADELGAVAKYNYDQEEHYGKVGLVVVSKTNTTTVHRPILIVKLHNLPGKATFDKYSLFFIFLFHRKLF